MKKTKQNSRFGTFLVFLLIYAFQIIYYLNAKMGQLHSDSDSYMYYSAQSGARTPGYPFVIDVCRILFHDRYESGVALVQIAISWLSVIAFYQTLKLITDKKGLSLFGTLFYGMSSAIFCFNTMILTDSLGVSFTVFFIYFAVKWLKGFSCFDGACLALICMMCPFIKTSLFVYAFAVLILLVLLLLFDKEHRKEVCFEFVLLILVLGVYLMYCYRNLYLVGVFNFSALGPRHQLVKCLQTGIYKLYPDKDLVDQITKIYLANDMDIEYGTTSQMMELFGDTYREQLMNLGEFCKYCNRAGRNELLHWNLGLVKNNFWLVFDNYYTQPAYKAPVFELVINAVNLIFNQMRIGFTYVVCALAAVIFVIKCFVKKNADWVWLGMAGGMLTILASVYIGTYGEWIRTLAYILPFAYVSIIMIINEVINIHYK